MTSSNETQVESNANTESAKGAWSKIQDAHQQRVERANDVGKSLIGKGEKGIVGSIINSPLSAGTQAIDAGARILGATAAAAFLPIAIATDTFKAAGNVVNKIYDRVAEGKPLDIKAPSRNDSLTYKTSRSIVNQGSKSLLSTGKAIGTLAVGTTAGITTASVVVASAATALTTSTVGGTVSRSIVDGPKGLVTGAKDGFTQGMRAIKGQDRRGEPKGEQQTTTQGKFLKAIGSALKAPFFGTANAIREGITKDLANEKKDIENIRIAKKAFENGVDINDERTAIDLMKKERQDLKSSVKTVSNVIQATAAFKGAGKKTDPITGIKQSDIQNAFSKEESQQELKTNSSEQENFSQRRNTLSALKKTVGNSVSKLNLFGKKASDQTEEKQRLIEEGSARSDDIVEQTQKSNRIGILNRMFGKKVKNKNSELQQEGQNLDENNVSSSEITQITQNISKKPENNSDQWRRLVESQGKKTTNFVGYSPNSEEEKTEITADTTIESLEARQKELFKQNISRVESVEESRRKAGSLAIAS
jgi:hypothetical protein